MDPEWGAFGEALLTEQAQNCEMSVILASRYKKINVLFFLEIQTAVYSLVSITRLMANAIYFVVECLTEMK